MLSGDGFLLKHNDRIIFGTHCVYLFKDPLKAGNTDSIIDSDFYPITWENV